MKQGVCCPRRRFVGMADIARIRDFQAVGSVRIDEVERVASDIHIGDGLLDLWHVAGNALTAGAPNRVMGMLLDRRGMRPILSVWPVTCQAHSARGLSQHGVILRTVRIVATETGDPPRVHQTGREIVALHAVLVRRAVGKMREGRLSELVILEFPEVVEVEADMKSDRPIVILPTDRVLERLPL